MSKFKPILVHHGILGMRWGVRRFQNKDGSYTAAGKKRYSVKDVENDIDASIKSNNEAYTRVKANGKKIADAADSLMEDYKKAYNSATLSKEAKDRIIKNLKQDFGVGCDDEDLYEMVVDDYAYEELMKTVNSKVQTKRASFDKLQDDYWKDVESLTKDVLEKYGNEKIKGHPLYNDGKAVANNLISQKLDTSMSSYIYRHFDDYWVNDIDEHYSAKDRFVSQLPSMKEYNALASKN